MEQRKKSKGSLLFLIALAPCLCFAQAVVNEGTLFVGKGADLRIVGTFENKNGAVLTNDGDLYVYNDFTNNGKVGFTSGQTSGKTWFQGEKKGNLNISGTGTSEFYNVEFNNTSTEPATAGYSLGTKLSVSGTVNFTKGFVTYASGSDLLTFENGAAANANDKSFVKDAAVVKKGNNAFTYPVGGGDKYRPAAISAPSDAGAVFKGQYFFKKPDNLDKIDPSSSLSLIDDAEYWEIKRTTGTDNVVVTLKWDEATTPSKIIDVSDNIHVVRWDESKSLWVDEGGVADASKKEVMTVSPLGNYGMFTLAKTKDSKDDVVLPNAGLSPNDDGVNDVLIIPGLDKYPKNKVTVFDRLGKILFDTTDYANTPNGINVFKGYLSNGDVLPPGTYFYTVDYRDSTGSRVRKSNYLYINLR